MTMIWTTDRPQPVCLNKAHGPDRYLTEMPEKIRVYQTEGSVHGTVWQVDGVSSCGCYTEEVDAFPTFQQAWADVPDFIEEMKVKHYNSPATSELRPFVLSTLPQPEQDWARP